MAEEKTTKPASEETTPSVDDQALSDEELKKVSGGAYEFYRQSKLAGVKIGGGVDESSPVPPPEPSPAINISQK